MSKLYKLPQYICARSKFKKLKTKSKYFIKGFHDVMATQAFVASITTLGASSGLDTLYVEYIASMHQHHWDRR